MSRRQRFMVVDDELIVRESLAAWLEQEGATVSKAESAEDALKLLEHHFYDILFVDIKMPGMGGFRLLEEVKKHYSATLVVIITAYGTVEHAVEALRLGANDFLVKPFDPDSLGLLLAKLMEHKKLLEEAQYLRNEATKSWAGAGDIIGTTPAMTDLFATINEVAPNESSILILGETGTGKELIARAIHANSKRIGGPFVPINCGAVPESLIESEIFGFEKGSFTGAVRPKKGLIEVAEGGTLFLDEVGEISPKMQVDLLRVLQDKSFYRVGGVDALKADFRLISATHKDLTKQLADGTLRQDFYYRINVITLRVPPLRERKADIPLLADHFLHRFARETNRAVDSISDAAMKILVDYPWPGNIRELENVLERAVVTSRRRIIAPEAFVYLGAEGICVPESSVAQTLKDAEKIHIRRILNQEGWNVTHAAKVLGLDRSTLHKKMRTYGLQEKRSD